jgi:hypothetical protein
MLYQNIIFTGFALSTTVQAAINFYGPDREKGDKVTCEFKDIEDEYASGYLDFFYPEQIIDGSDNFAFDEPVQCGKGALHDAEQTCQHLGGETTCIPKQTCLLGIPIPIFCFSKSSARRSVLYQSIGRRFPAPINKPDSELDFDKRGSIGQALERRDGAECNKLNSQCNNQYPKTKEPCRSGFTEEAFPVEGKPDDLWCSKPCTDEETTNCKNQACAMPKEVYGNTNRVKSCQKALFVCPPGPIKMDKSICNLGKLGVFGRVCKEAKLTGVVYQNGACSIIEADFKKAMATLGQFGRV